MVVIVSIVVVVVVIVVGAMGDRGWGKRHLGRSALGTVLATLGALERVSIGEIIAGSG